MIHNFQDLGVNKVVYATYFDGEKACHALAQIVPDIYEREEGEFTVQYLGMNKGEKFIHSIDTLDLVTTKFELGPRPKKKKLAHIWDTQLKANEINGHPFEPKEKKVKKVKKVPAKPNSSEMMNNNVPTRKDDNVSFYLR